MGPAVVVAVVLVAVAVGLAARRRLGFITVVESESMVPTLAPGQRLLTRRRGVSRPVRRGDIVVIQSAELGRVIVKRVVGLPGEHVDVAVGEVHVDGRRLPEPYVLRRGGGSGSFDVPGDHLLLLGDNRAQSSDSRTWRQPYLAISALRGIVLPHRDDLSQRTQPATWLPARWGLHALLGRPHGSTAHGPTRRAWKQKTDCGGSIP